MNRQFLGFILIIIGEYISNRHMEKDFNSPTSNEPETIQYIHANFRCTSNCRRDLLLGNILQGLR
jgi:hypothetical protein